jgi:hypothetical protein
MLVPLSRATFEQLIPIVATGNQYRYYWGKWADFIRRLIISIIAVCLIAFVVGYFVGDDFGWLVLLLSIAAGFYWLWIPIFLATKQNIGNRNYSYSGLWRGEVLDMYLSEAVVSEREVVKKGKLTIVEDVEEELNLEIGDDSGFITEIRVPFQKNYKAISIGQTVEMLVMSYRPDLSSFAKISDLYLPNLNLWVGNYPVVERKMFANLSVRMASELAEEAPKRRRRGRSQR